jgi:glycosyltransferase involved in cell wall biosynthesis
MSEISIIIPVYNAGEYLEKTLASISEDASHEIVLVDDGSTDQKTREILEKYKGIHRVIRQENSGTAAARNRGAGEAKGEYIIFLDADDLFEKNFCTRMLETLKKNPDVSYTYPNSVLFGSRIGYWETLDFDRRLLLYYGYFLVNSLMKKSMFDELGGLDTSFTYLEDREFWVRTAVRGYKGLKTPVLHFYRHHTTSKTATVNRGKKMNYWERLIHQKYKKEYRLSDYFNFKILFYSTYIRFFFLVPERLKDHLLLKSLRTLFQKNPDIATRFPEEVVADYQKAGLLSG